MTTAQTTAKPKIPVNLVQRIILERDLTDSRSVTYDLPDGTVAEFVIHTLTNEQKLEIRRTYDKFFPTPPTITTKAGIVQFDLEDEAYQKKLQDWNLRLSRGVLAATLKITEEEVALIELQFPREFVGELFAKIELLNGIQSDPLIDLVRDAMWAPEVLTWLETHKGNDDGVKVSDTPLFREMEAMVACGLTLAQWEDLSPRHKIMYLNYHTYKTAREAYIHDMSEKKIKDQQTQRRVL
jgi:hypothetical protein